MWSSTLVYRWQTRIILDLHKLSHILLIPYFSLKMFSHNFLLILSTYVKTIDIQFKQIRYTTQWYQWFKYFNIKGSFNETWQQQPIYLSKPDENNANKEVAVFTHRAHYWSLPVKYWNKSSRINYTFVNVIFDNIWARETIKYIDKCQLALFVIFTLSILI